MSYSSSALQWLRGTIEVHDEMDEMKQALKCDIGAAFESIMSEKGLPRVIDQSRNEQWAQVMGECAKSLNDLLPPDGLIDGVTVFKDKKEHLTLQSYTKAIMSSGLLAKLSVFAQAINKYEDHMGGQKHDLRSQLLKTVQIKSPLLDEHTVKTTPTALELNEQLFTLQRNHIQSKTTTLLEPLTTGLEQQFVADQRTDDQL